MVIDFHSHNFPASLAARAIEVMCGKLAAMNEQMGGNSSGEAMDGKRLTCSCALTLYNATKHDLGSAVGGIDGYSSGLGLFVQSSDLVGHRLQNRSPENNVRKQRVR